MIVHTCVCVAVKIMCRLYVASLQLTCAKCTSLYRVKNLLNTTLGLALNSRHAFLTQVESILGAIPPQLPSVKLSYYTNCKQELASMKCSFSSPYN